MPHQTQSDHIELPAFLRSHEWLLFQHSLGRKTFEIDRNQVQAGVVQHDSWLRQNYLYIPQGPRIYFNRPEDDPIHDVELFINELKRIGTQERSIFALAEPTSPVVARMLIKHGFRKSPKHIQPQQTVIIDIQPPEDKLLAAMHQKTRYNIHVAERDGIEVRQSETIDDFLRLLGKTTRRDGFTPHRHSYYQAMFDFFENGHEMIVKCFTAYHQDIPVASALILLYGQAAFYLHGASDYAYHQHMAPYVLHWSVIGWLKTQDHRWYDLWGIDEARYPGVTKFKLGWGGRVVTYPGAFVLPLRPFAYMLYRITRSIKDYVSRK